MSTAYPLTWPMEWPRTRGTTRSKFGEHTVHAAVDEVMRQLKMLYATDVIISSNVTLGSYAPTDKGVCVYFKIKARPYALPCDKWDRVQDNLWALGKHIESLRLQERWGVGSIERQFAGYVALPVPISDKTPWREVLNIGEKATVTDATDAYRDLARRYHPDTPTGSHEKMTILNRAWSEAKRHFGIT